MVRKNKFGVKKSWFGCGVRRVSGCHAALLQCFLFDELKNAVQWFLRFAFVMCCGTVLHLSDLGTVTLRCLHTKTYLTPQFGSIHFSFVSILSPNGDVFACAPDSRGSAPHIGSDRATAHLLAVARHLPAALPAGADSTATPAKFAVQFRAGLRLSGAA